MLGELARDAYHGSEYLSAVANGDALPDKLGPGVESVERTEGGEGARAFSKIKVKLRDPLPYIQELNRIDGIGKEDSDGNIKVVLQQIMNVTSPSATGFAPYAFEAGKRVSMADIKAEQDKIPARNRGQSVLVSPDSPDAGQAAGSGNAPVSAVLPLSDHKGSSVPVNPSASCEAVSSEKPAISGETSKQAEKDAISQNVQAVPAAPDAAGGADRSLSCNAEAVKNVSEPIAPAADTPAPVPVMDSAPATPAKDTEKHSRFTNAMQESDSAASTPVTPDAVTETPSIQDIKQP
jgi:hypothetical protein